MHQKALQLILITVITFVACGRQNQEFPLYRVDGIPAEQVIVGGVIGEYFSQTAIGEYAKPPSVQIDSSLATEFILTDISEENLYRSIIQLQQLAIAYANSGNDMLLKKALDGWQHINDKYLPLIESDRSKGQFLFAWVQLNSALLKITGEPKYASMLEESVYNGMIACNSKDSAVLAENVQVYKHEIIPHFYTRYLDEIYVNIFGSSSMQYNHTTGGSVRIIQDTNYPYDGFVKLKFELDDKRYVDLHIRIPEWAEKATLTVGGVKYKTVPGQYAQITKKWRTGDEVELILPMRPNVVTNETKGANDSKSFRLKYGSLDLATSLCDYSGHSFRGDDPMMNLRFVSPIGKVPTFTFGGIEDTTLVFQPYFVLRAIDSQYASKWILWDK